MEPAQEAQALKLNTAKEVATIMVTAAQDIKGVLFLAGERGKRRCCFGCHGSSFFISLLTRKRQNELSGGIGTRAGWRPAAALAAGSLGLPVEEGGGPAQRP
jgi:hypothetical protein